MEKSEVSNQIKNIAMILTLMMHGDISNSHQGLLGFKQAFGIEYNFCMSLLLKQGHKYKTCIQLVLDPRLLEM